jgi:hypothetical protein
VSAFARVYTNTPLESAVSVSAQIRNYAGEVVLAESRPVMEHVAGNQVDYELRLPVAALAPGNYALTVTATSRAHSAARRTLFSIEAGSR